jgi:tRNA nucleotidyltransferase (CCA-adding enzyme)
VRVSTGTGRSALDDAAAAALLSAAPVPRPVIDAARQLQDAGHSAVLVGGAVRDVLLGLPASDWDLASSATPDEVMAIFPKTIPTGVQHGTVTVLLRGAGQTHPVEITTFRGEGAYVDGRRPQSVRFLRKLIEDLARRDFTINAFAWDPIEQRFSDPFDGLSDLAAGLVRAVGIPLHRFREDGLRTMRAVRFCATRTLRLEEKTEAAIPEALDVLAKVSRERVHAELVKLLGSPRPSLGLRPMWRTGIWPHALVPLPSEADYEQAISAVDRMAPDPTARLARLLWPLGGQEGAEARIEACVEALKPSRTERATVLALTGRAARALQAARTPVEIRRAVAELRVELLPAALDVLELDDARREAVREAIEGAALTIGELALKGGDLVAEGIVAKGPMVGQRLAELLDDVLVDPGLNARERLLDRARTRGG